MLELCRRSVAGVAAIGVVAALAGAAHADTGWYGTGSMASPRGYHSATALPDGRVLIVGGFGGDSFHSRGSQPGITSAETYDSATGAWSSAGSMSASRDDHTATLLPTGAVLVAGGNVNGTAGSLASSEIYDPRTGVWSAGASMAEDRSGHSAARLANGRVLVAGGVGGVAPTVYRSSAEVYDASTNVWSSAGNMAEERVGLTSVTLTDGRVLIAGGTGPPNNAPLASAEVYDPRTNNWSHAGNLAIGRNQNTMTLLPNGKVLFAGGVDAAGRVLASVDLYDPATNTWSPATSMSYARANFTATLRPDGKVLVAGGYVNGNMPIMSELYDPASDSWSDAGALIFHRTNHTATLLPTGEVLVAGGSGNTGRYRSQAERYGELPPQCADGRDNDYDSASDFPADAECTSPSDDSELPTPTVGKEVNVERVEGSVLVRPPPGSAPPPEPPLSRIRAAAAPGGFVPLIDSAQIALGAVLDTRKGTARMTAARNVNGRSQVGKFSGGEFKVRQETARKPVTDLILRGGSFRQCVTDLGSKPRAARRVVRSLWGRARGRYRTRGRYASATVRGTRWSIQDTCGGTLVRVQEGSVVVRDFARRRNIKVRAGGHYLARPRRQR